MKRGERRPFPADDTYFFPVVKDKKVAAYQVVAPICVGVNLSAHAVKTGIGNPPFRVFPVYGKGVRRRGCGKFPVRKRSYAEYGVARFRIRPVALTAVVVTAQDTSAPRISDNSAVYIAFHPGNGVAVLNFPVVIVGGGNSAGKSSLAARTHVAYGVTGDYLAPVFTHDAAGVVVRAHGAVVVALFHPAVVVESDHSAHGLFACHIPVHAKTVYRSQG